MKPDYAAILQDVGRRAEHLVTVRLVAYVSEFEQRGTPQLSIRSIAEICRCRPNSAMVAVQEGTSKGWLERTPHKNSAVFVIGQAGLETSQLLRQSPADEQRENVSNIETLSDSKASKSAEIVSKIETEDASDPPSEATNVSKIETEPSVVSQKLRRFEPGTKFDSRACDSPYPLPLIVSSHVGVSEESPSLKPPPLLAAAGLVESVPSGNSKNGDESPKRGRAKVEAELRLAFERFWPLYPRRDDKHEALEVWMRDIRLEHVEDVIQAAILYAARQKGEERRFTKLAKRWLLKGRWRSEFENAKEAQAPTLTPAQASAAEAKRRAALLRAEIAREQNQPVEVPQ